MQFLELQEQLGAYSRDIRSVQVKISAAQREERANQVTKNHIASLPPDVPTYRATGKAFILTPKSEIEERLDKEYGHLIKMQRDLLDRKEYLERRIQSTSSNIRDLTA
jgi:chaperonin cofactor prefoldin